jgi:cytochrome c553
MIPEVYRMPACRNCRFYCKPCLTLEEAEAVLESPETAAWKGNTLCQRCHVKSNHKQNELIAEANGHGKLKGRAAKLQALLDALEECERTGYEMTAEELQQLNAAMAELGVTV